MSTGVPKLSICKAAAKYIWPVNMIMQICLGVHVWKKRYKKEEKKVLHFPYVTFWSQRHFWSDIVRITMSITIVFDKLEDSFTYICGQVLTENREITAKMWLSFFLLYTDFMLCLCSCWFSLCFLSTTHWVDCMLQACPTCKCLFACINLGWQQIPAVYLLPTHHMLGKPPEQKKQKVDKPNQWGAI